MAATRRLKIKLGAGGIPPAPSPGPAPPPPPPAPPPPPPPPPAPVPPVFTSGALPAGVVGLAYSHTLVATGAVSYALSAGVLPAGLSFSVDTISGTPTTVQTTSVTFSATNADGTTPASHLVAIFADNAVTYLGVAVTHLGVPVTHTP